MWTRGVLQDEPARKRLRRRSAPPHGPGLTGEPLLLKQRGLEKILPPEAFDPPEDLLAWREPRPNTAAQMAFYRQLDVVGLLNYQTGTTASDPVEDQKVSPKMFVRSHFTAIKCA